MAKTGFYILSVLVILMLVLLVKNKQKDPGKTITRYFMIMGIWIAYIIGLTVSGVLNDFDLPPRVPLLIIIPSIIFSIYITGRTSFRDILQLTPIHYPIFMQGFRILVELLIFTAWSEGYFPKRVTFEGLNYDILVGATAPVMGWLLMKNKLGLNAALIWNIAAMMILSVTGYAFISAYFFPGFAEGIDKTHFIKFPFILLPSVLLSIAIFLHIFSIRQILMKKKELLTR
ncbi:MAG TPA: hypothetical protein VFX73_08465 [Chitinophagaceae bacterium]|nr:hypothetical protein [Chitinophagaceae bacterium]